MKHIFISDVHLGLRIGDYRQREILFASFLQRLALRDDIASIYLLGDIFDFWYEYKYVIPRGFTRTLSALATLSDKGVELHFLAGNHDTWAFSYFQDELGINVHFDEYIERDICGKHLILSHGDIPKCNTLGYRCMRKAFRCRFLQRLFSAVHPTLAFSFGLGWSEKRRSSNGNYIFRMEEEPLYKFVTKLSGDYFIFGHLHSPVDCILPSGARFVLLGDWMNNPQVAILEEGTLSVKNLDETYCGEF